MADIQTELDKIAVASFGRDVRGSIGDALKKINEVVENFDGNFELKVGGALVNISNVNKDEICGGTTDGLPNNKIYGKQPAATLTNDPFPNVYCNYITYGKNTVRSAGDLQVAIDAKNNYAYRVYGGSNGWCGWAMSFSGSAITITSDNAETVCAGSVDNLYNNKVYVKDAAATLENDPFEGKASTIITYGINPRRATGDVQVAYTMDGQMSKRMYSNTKWSRWTVAFSGVGLNITEENKAEVCGGDLDGLSNNQVFGIGSGTTLINDPLAGIWHGMITFGKTFARSAGDMQIAYTLDGRKLYRVFDSSSWSRWQSNFRATTTNILETNKAAICGGDVDNMPNNTIYGKSADCSLLNDPASGFYSTISTFGKIETTRSSGDFQLSVTKNDIIFRSYGNNKWGGWVSLITGDNKGNCAYNTQYFREAYGVMLSRLQETYPDAEILCCTINACDRRSATGDGFPDLSYDGDTVDDYNKAIRELASAFNCKVIDHARCGIHYYNMNTTMDDYDDYDESSEKSRQYGLHPNAKGMALIARETIRELDPSALTNYGHSIYEGKKYSVLGDSISTYQGWGGAPYHYPRGDVDSVNKTWWKITADTLGLVYCQNNTVGGRACCTVRDQQYEGKGGCRQDEINLLKKGSDIPDIIFVKLGVNDYGSVNSGKNNVIDGVAQRGGLGVYNGSTPVKDIPQIPAESDNPIRR